MANLSVNVSGYGAVTAESIVATGNIEAQGQFLAKNGTAGSPGYAFKNAGNYGLFAVPASSRLEISANGTEKAYWGSVNHNYISTSFANSISVSGASNLGSGSIYLSFVVTPAQITANQNNYTGFTGTMNRVSTDASRNITGMTAGGAGGHIKFIMNVGSFDLVFTNDDAASDVDKRFLTANGGAYTLSPADIAICIYDSVVSKWRIGRMS